MPTRPTTPTQKEDAQRLNELYLAWRDAGDSGNEKRNQDLVADRIGISQSAVAQMLSGKMAISAKRAVMFAGLFECKVSDFSPTLAQEIDKLAPAKASAAVKAVRGIDFETLARVELRKEGEEIRAVIESFLDRVADLQDEIHAESARSVRKNTPSEV